MADEGRDRRSSRDGGRRQDDDRRASSPRGGKPDRGGAGRGGAARGGAGRSGAGPDRRRGDNRDTRPVRDTAGARTADQAAYDGPELDPTITGQELDKVILNQLKSLPEKLANRVARHLVAAGMTIDDEPEIAFQHARAARIRAPRIAVVREAAGESAYAAGHYAEALADLRAAKRMNGATAYLPIMADCHRALGHPEQALRLSKSPSVAGFPSEAKAEMTIVEAGARRDMGQLDAALRTLELAPLQSKARDAWVVRLRYTYADTLEAAGRFSDAIAWFHRANAIDADEVTDAAERASVLEKQHPSD